MTGAKGVARRALAGVLAAGAVLATAALSRTPVEVAGDDPDGLVRLSWRLRSDAGVGACRTPTAEELERLPVHMRNPGACMGAGLAFALTVELDGERVVADTLEPAGARGDRPVFVLRDLRVTPGPHRLAVRFEPLGDTEARSYSFAGTVEVEPRRIVLLTYDSEAQRLVTRENSER